MKDSKMTPLRIYDFSVTKDWSIKKAAIYERDVTNVIRFMEKRGKPLTIEYIDEYLNVVSTLKYKGNKKKALEYETVMNRTLKEWRKEDERQ